MSRREEIVLALAVLSWAFLVPSVIFLVYSSLHGFDPTLCDAYGQCGWRYA